MCSIPGISKLRIRSLLLLACLALLSTARAEGYSQHSWLKDLSEADRQLGRALIPFAALTFKHPAPKTTQSLGDFIREVNAIAKARGSSLTIKVPDFFRNLPVIPKTGNSPQENPELTRKLIEEDPGWDFAHDVWLALSKYGMTLQADRNGHVEVTAKTNPDRMSTIYTDAFVLEPELYDKLSRRLKGIGGDKPKEAMPVPPDVNQGIFEFGLRQSAAHMYIYGTFDHSLTVRAPHWRHLVLHAHLETLRRYPGK